MGYFTAVQGSFYQGQQCLEFSVNGNGKKHQAEWRLTSAKIIDFALDLFKTIIGSIVFIGTLGLIGTLEIVTRLVTFGQGSLINPIIENILTPSCSMDPDKRGLGSLGQEAWNLQLVNITPFQLKNEADPSQPAIQAYHVKNETVSSKPKRLVVVCNPNAAGCESSSWHMIARWDAQRIYPNYELEFLFFDYRGTGKSEGHMYHLGDAIKDGKLAAQWAAQWTKENGLDMSSVTFSGASLGGGCATAIAQDHPEAHLVLTHTFKSWTKAAERVAKNIFFGGNVGWIARPLADLLGGSHMDCQKALIQRHKNASERELPIGLTYIRTALQDRAIAEEARLMIPEDCLNGNCANYYLLELQDTEHMEIVR